MFEKVFESHSYAEVIYIMTSPFKHQFDKKEKCHKC